jgi:hypothetical protein
LGIGIVIIKYLIIRTCLIITIKVLDWFTIHRYRVVYVISVGWRAFCIKTSLACTGIGCYVYISDCIVVAGAEGEDEAVIGVVVGGDVGEGIIGT